MRASARDAVHLQVGVNLGARVSPLEDGDRGPVADQREAVPIPPRDLAAQDVGVQQDDLADALLPQKQERFEQPDLISGATLADVQAQECPASVPTGPG